MGDVDHAPAKVGWAKVAQPPAAWALAHLYTTTKAGRTPPPSRFSKDEAAEGVVARRWASHHSSLELELFVSLLELLQGFVKLMS
jgi:hypothetical protein